MNRNHSMRSVCHGQRRIARRVVRGLIGAQITVYCLAAMGLTWGDADGRNGCQKGVAAMEARRSSEREGSVQTPSGRISYVEQGTGPVALFVHGVLLNKHLWRHQLANLSDIRRCIAPDLLAHGDTEMSPAQNVSVTANANMLRELLDAQLIDQVDLVGNDSGGGIAQIFAASFPDRVRTLTLTNCDASDNWPPEPFKPFLAMAASGGLPEALQGMLSNKEIYRSANALGPAYEHPDQVTD